MVRGWDNQRRHVNLKLTAGIGANDSVLEERGKVVLSYFGYTSKMVKNGLSSWKNENN